MSLTAEQIKGRIKNLAKNSNTDATVLLRIYMMERFLERVSNSKYAENFIIKGGVLVTSLVGISMRSTMDIDTSFRNINLSADDACRIVEEIAAINLADGVTFEIRDVENIMDGMEYPGIRIGINALLERTVTPLKIDISTGDAITPKSIEYSYKLMLEDREIKLWAYNLETMLAEKLQTILARGVLNTRMRDFYDIYILLAAYESKINKSIFSKAFDATCIKRKTMNIKDNSGQIAIRIATDNNILRLWEAYRKKYTYAESITFSETIASINKLISFLDK